MEMEVEMETTAADNSQIAKKIDNYILRFYQAGRLNRRQDVENYIVGIVNTGYSLNFKPALLPKCNSALGTQQKTKSHLVPRTGI